jgi:hypothetical protein
VTKPIPLRLSPIILQYLDELATTGAYGKNRSVVMRRFIENGIVSALQGGVIAKKHVADFKPSDDNDEEEGDG